MPGVAGSIVTGVLDVALTIVSDMLDVAVTLVLSGRWPVRVDRPSVLEPKSSGRMLASGPMSSSLIDLPVASTVPASVPSDFQSSRPWMPSSAEK